MKGPWLLNLFWFCEWALNMHCVIFLIFWFCLYLCIEGVVVCEYKLFVDWGVCCFLNVLIRWSGEVFWNLVGCWSLIQNKFIDSDSSKLKSIFWERILLFQYIQVRVVLVILGFYHVCWILTLHKNKFLFFPLGWRMSCVHHKVTVIDFWHMEFCSFNLVL